MSAAALSDVNLVVSVEVSGFTDPMSKTWLTRDNVDEGAREPTPSRCFCGHENEGQKCLINGS